MKRKRGFSSYQVFPKKGSGLLNSLINKLPIELHIPGYNYCGPGTNLKKRLARNDQGINPLDEACKVHDLAYAKTSDIEGRHKADKILEEAASQRLSSRDASIKEKMAAFGVKGVMNVKRKLGMGMKNKKLYKVKKGGALKNKRKIPQKKRVISIPKKGGFLPFLLPLLGALGAVGGGAASIAKAVNDAKAQQKQLEETKRHDLAMEQNAKGKGLYLRPYKGYGMYLKPFKKNSQ